MSCCVEWCLQGTLCKGKDRGAKKEVRGYWLDLVVSPFFAVGVDSDRVSIGGFSVFFVPCVPSSLMNAHIDR